MTWSVFGFAKSENWNPPICLLQRSLVIYCPIHHDAGLRLSRCCICCEFCCQKEFPFFHFPPPCFSPGGQTLQSCPQVLDVAFQLIYSTSSCLAPGIGNRFFAGKHLQSLAVGPKCLKSSSHLKVVNRSSRNESIRNLENLHFKPLQIISSPALFQSDIVGLSLTKKAICLVV